MNQAENDNDCSPCSPAWEFDHIVAQVLSSLPQLDVFRLRRVCRRFDQLMRLRMESVVLNGYGLELQLRERGVTRLDFQNVAARILEFYGRWITKLEIRFPMYVSKDDEKSVVLKIIAECPNLRDLRLKCFNNNYFRDIPNFPATGLLVMPDLRILDAKLSLELVDAGPEGEIIERIEQLEKLSSIDLVEGELREMVRTNGLVLESAKELIFGTIIPPSFESFPGAELWKVNVESNSIFPVEFLPKILSKLDIVLIDFKFSTEDVDSFKLLVHITDFRIHHFSSGILPNYNFLSSFLKLTNICIEFLVNFTANDFLLIPEKAPLTRVTLSGCPANCAQVYRAIMDRMYRLDTMNLWHKPEERDRECDAVLELVEFNQGSLDRLKCTVLNDQSLERLPSGFLVKPAFLNFKCCDSLSAEGVRGMLHRRKELLAEKWGWVEGRLNVQSGSGVTTSLEGSRVGRCGGLLVILLEEKIAKELLMDSQELLVESLAFVEFTSILAIS